MNYVCVSVNRDVVTKKSFDSRAKAIDYFQQEYGKEICEERAWQEEKLETRIQNYEKKIQRYEYILAHPEGKLAVTEKGRENLKNCCARKEKTEEALEQMRRDFLIKPLSYEAKYDDYKEGILLEQPLVLLHVCGIYQRGNEFWVIAEKYSCIGKRVEQEETAVAAARKLPKTSEKDRIFLYVCPEKAGKERETLDKVLKELSNFRAKLSRSFESDSARLKEKEKKVFRKTESMLEE